MTDLLRASLWLTVLALGVFIAPGCDPQATKDASIPCKNDIECSPGLACMPTRHGLTGECNPPACSRKCRTDADCKGIRFSSDNKECFTCKDVSVCAGSNGQSAEAGTLQVCVDRCEFVPVVK